MYPHQRLEHEFGKFAGYDAANVVACNSGTAAIHLALEAPMLGAAPGRRVLIPDYTMVAVPRACSMADLSPFPVDVTPLSLLLDPIAVAACLDGGEALWCPNPVALIAVHTYGRRCDMDALHFLAERWRLFVVEDLAEAHGVTPHPKTHAACWSYYKNKIVFGEEGGCVAFRDVRHADRARRLRSLGFTEAHDYTHEPRGHNYRMADCLAGLVSIRLAAYTVWHEIRAEQVGMLDAGCPPDFILPQRDANWVYDFRVKNMTAVQQKRVVEELQMMGVGARFGFKPISWQEEYYDPLAKLRHPNTYAAQSEVVYLPLGQSAPEKGYTPDLVRAVFDTVRGVMAGVAG